MNMATIAQKADSLIKEAPFIAGINNPEQHAEALALVEELIELPDQSEWLIHLVGRAIEEYEDSAPEFEEFNASIEKLDEVDALQLLIDQHNLKLKDLPEIGGKSHVSQVLSRTKSLTKEHIKALCARFNLPSSFFLR